MNPAHTGKSLLELGDSLWLLHEVVVREEAAP